MKNKIVLFGFLFGLLFVIGCQEQEARRPIKKSTGSFIKESIQRNKKLIALEEKKIDSIIKKNPDKKFIASKKGYWYSYEIKNETDTLKPKFGDIVKFDYEIYDLNDNIIYTALELRPQKYYVDKQEIMIGLRDAIKLMHKNEKIMFLFPSHLAFGYIGDKNRIGPNVPIKCIVTVNEIIHEKDITNKTN